MFSNETFKFPSEDADGKEGPEDDGWNEDGQVENGVEEDLRHEEKDTDVGGFDGKGREKAYADEDFGDANKHSE